MNFNDYLSYWGSVVINEVKNQDYFITVMGDSAVVRYTITVIRTNNIDSPVSWYELHNNQLQLFSITKS